MGSQFSRHIVFVLQLSYISLELRMEKISLNNDQALKLLKYYVTILEMKSF